jgi:hypothetical protein
MPKFAIGQLSRRILMHTPIQNIATSSTRATAPWCASRTESLGHLSIPGANGARSVLTACCAISQCAKQYIILIFRLTLPLKDFTTIHMRAAFFGSALILNSVQGNVRPRLE